LAKSIVKILVTILILGSLNAVSASAQSLPALSRTVYKCNVNGRVAYSDSPCLGAERLEIEPSRGVGRTAGADVQRERAREALADAIRPLTGMDAKQFEVQSRRMKLTAAAQRECRALDIDLPAKEHAVAASSGGLRQEEERQLFSLRQRYRYLGC
jgi:hypothetical protein